MGSLVSTRAAAGGPAAAAGPAGAEEALADVLTANYPLTHALYKVIHEARTGDVCLSPALLQLSLGALAAGATGTASAELRALLRPGGADANQRHSARGHAALRDHLHRLKDVTIATALRIYTPDTMKLLKDWFVSSTKNFSVCIKPTNFIKSQDELLRTVNSWVKSKTKNQISELIPPETIYSIIQLLSVCAAYFQCDLEYPFYAENTTNDLFYVNNQDTRPVKLMHQVNIFRYAELDNLKCQALEMPYKNPDLRFIVLLPFTADGLPTLEQDFVHINFVELLENMIYAKVLVSIPSFKLQESYDICDYLDKIGLSSLMISSERPFMKISEENPPASLTHFNHMLAFNFMEVNKDHIRTGSTQHEIEADTIVFRADHSFMFIVLDVSLNMILIIGRINCLNRYTTPTFQRVAFNQLDKQCQQYMESQILSTIETGLTVTERKEKVTSETNDITLPIELGIELHEHDTENIRSQIKLNDKYIFNNIIERNI